MKTSFRHRRLLWGLLAGLLLLAAAPAWTAPAVAVTYAKPTRTFRVAMLLLHSQTRTMFGHTVNYWCADPWYLSVLNHSPYKPAGWTMENPLAPGALPDDPDLIRSGNFYSAEGNTNAPPIGPGGKGGAKSLSLEGIADPWNPQAGFPTNWYLNSRPYANAIGAPLTKDDPAYWMVKLDNKSLDALAGFDLLILNGHSSSTLENDDKENIRLLLERGATIMVNNSQRAGAQFNNFFLDPPIIFNSNTTGNANFYNDTKGKRLVKVAPNHWLLNAVYQLNDDQVNCLRDALSYNSFIASGVAGYGYDPRTGLYSKCANSQVFEVVRLTPANYPSPLLPPTWTNGTNYQKDDVVIGPDGHSYVCIKPHTSDLLSQPGSPGNGWSTWWKPCDSYPNTAVYPWPNATTPQNFAPALAAGRIGNGLVVVSGGDLCGGTSDWWENWHVQYPRNGVPSNAAPDPTFSLDRWPYTPALAITGKKMNDALSYDACARLFFNILARPTDWRMTSGNPTADRNYPRAMASVLARGWTTPFTALSDPVATDNYLAVTGSSTVNTVPNELRVYRVKRLVGSDSIALDYPYGLVDETGLQVTPSRTGGVRPAWWSGKPANAAGAWLPGGNYLVNDVVVGPDGQLYLCLAAHVAGPLSQPGAPGVAWRTWWSPYIYYPDDAVTDGEQDLCFTLSLNQYAAVGAPAQWIGTPVFGQVADYVNGRWVSRTMLYALQYINDGTTVRVRPRCYPIDPFESTNVRGDKQVGIDEWADNPYTEFTLAAAGLPRASMTFNNGRLVITTFGTSDQVPQHIFMLDGRSGKVCATVAPDSGWNGYYRLTSPASLVTAQMDVIFQPSDLQVGNLSGVNPSTGTFYQAYDVSKQTLEVLAVNGEYAGAKPLTPTARHQGTRPALFLVPPTITVDLMAGARAAASVVPYSVYLKDASGVRHYFYPQGSENVPSDADAFIRTHTVSVKSGGNILKITFDSWNIFFPRGISDTPALSLPLVVGFTQIIQNVSTTGRAGTAQAKTYELPVAALSMGYAIPLQGSQRFSTWGKCTLRTADGDVNPDQNVVTGNYDFWPIGYGVDAPPLVYHNMIITGTNTAGSSGYGSLANSLNVPLSFVQNRGGALIGFRIAHDGLSEAVRPIMSSHDGDVLWQFQGDSFGPQGAAGNALAFWRSDFPFPAATGRDSVFTAALYNGFGDYNGDNYAPYTPPVPSGMLYALAPSPLRTLMQSVVAGAVAADRTNLSGVQLLVTVPNTTMQITGPLRVGARALLKVKKLNPDVPVSSTDWYTWDQGHIMQVRKLNGTQYIVTFDRAVPDPAEFANGRSELLTATDVPYLSHVRGWNAKIGSDTERMYTRNTGAGPTPMVRVGVGTTLPNVGDSACPDPRAIQDVMLAFTDLAYTCHEPDPALSANAQQTLVPADLDHLVDAKGAPTFLPADWANNGQTYLPPRPVQGTATAMNGLPVINYQVDARTGRIELSPAIAGEFADRFVAVHYFTVDFDPVALTMSKVRHAEIMYIPTQIQWRYQFPAAVPDGGPVVVNDTVYQPAVRQITVNGATRWQPSLYAFAAQQVNGLTVQPLWVQAVGPAISDPRLPYHLITTPAPVGNGVVVGTGVPVPGMNPNPTNELALFTDRGLLIGDGHRVVRLDSDGQVTWQVSATRDFDPVALMSGNANTRLAGLFQRSLGLVTRVHNLPSTHLLLCDTGANRVVEVDRDGNVMWQYPDSDVTYQDPDTVYDAANDVWIPARDSSASPAVELIPIGALRTPTPSVMRLSAPRDVRRYAHDIPMTAVFWRNTNMGAAVVHWETTLITDSGHNRLIEVYRPTVSLALQDAVLTYKNPNPIFKLATGYQYRPDMYYFDAAGAKHYLQQHAVVLVDGSAIRYNGAAFGQTLTFTNAMRYRGPDDQLIEVERTVEVPTLDPAFDSVQTRELLVAVGGTVPDPTTAGAFVRTLRLSVPTPGGVCVIRNFATLSGAHAAGSTTLIVDYNAEFRVGEAVTIKSTDGTTTQDLGTVTAVTTNPATGQRSLTVTIPLALGYADRSTVLRKATNALAVRPNSYDYGGILQLDIVTLLTSPGATTKEAHVMVVDQSGVREVPLDPARQLTPIFELTQTGYTAALQNSAWWGVKEATLISTDATKLENWRKDTLFAPVSVLREDNGTGTASADPHQVRYLIAQLNGIAGADGQRRIHLYEMRWVNPYNAAEGWGIIDSTLNYSLYPDPLSPDYPNLPGWSYPLSQPLAMDRD